MCTCTFEQGKPREEIGEALILTPVTLYEPRLTQGRGRWSPDFMDNRYIIVLGFLGL